jgi:hypothetical protein
MSRSSSFDPRAAPGDGWARMDGRGRGASAGWRDDADVAERRPPSGPFATAPRPPDRRRLVRLVLAGVLLAAAAGLLVYGLLARGARQAPPPAALAEFSLPAGWADRTAELAPRVRGTRPEYVFQGPGTAGFAANLNVVRQPRGPDDPPLARLVELVSGQVRTELRATPVGAPRPLSVDHEPALAYDYRYRAGGIPLRARQVAVYHGERVVFLNFTAHERSFTRDVRALDRMIATWRWR